VQVQRVLKLRHVAALVVTQRGVGVHHTYRTTDKPQISFASNELGARRQ
jgi:hypothetical protein